MKALLCHGSKLGETLHDLVGRNACIVELAAFITTEDARRQIIHSDTFWSETSSAFTCTVALQDIDEEMGPTVFIHQGIVSGAGSRVSVDGGGSTNINRHRHFHSLSSVRTYLLIIFSTVL